MILITGASGHMGRAIIGFLQKKHSAIGQPAALVRSREKGRDLEAQGCELRIGDYFDPPSLAGAMKGVETLMFISGSDFHERVKQHANVVTAAREAGVGQIIYTSILGAPDVADNPIGSDHYQTEQLIRGTGIPYTFFRETFYLDVLPDFFGAAVEKGLWSYASGGQKVNLAARIDMAEALANILADPGAHTNRVYEIVGREALSFDQLTRILSDAVSKTITYRELSSEDLKEMLRKAGVDEGTIAGAAAVSDVISSGHLNYTDPALERLLGRKPQSARDFLKQKAAEEQQAKHRK